MNLSDPKTKILLAAGGAAVLLIIVLILVFAGGEPSPDPPPPPPPPKPDDVIPVDDDVRSTEEDPETLPGFDVIRIRKRPAGAFEVFWELSGQISIKAVSFRLTRWDSDSMEWSTVASDLPPSRRSAGDPSDKQEGVEYAYRALLATDDGQAYLSTEGAVTYEPRPLPPTPEGLSARWIRIDGEDMVHLEWTPRKADDPLTRGFAVYADDKEVDVFSTKIAAPPLLDAAYVTSVGSPDREVRFQVAAVDVEGQEGVPAEVVLAPNRSSVPRPGDLNVSRQDAPGAPIVLTWTYPPGVGVAGFRIYNRGRLLAGPGVLPGNARTWEDRFLSRRLAARYEIEAVTPTGEVSDRTAAVPFRIPEEAKALLDAPIGVSAEWTRVANELQVRIRWQKPRIPDPKVSSYALEVDEQAGAKTFSSVRKGLAVSDEAVVFPPPGGTPRVYVFQLRAVDASGQEGFPTVVTLPSPQQFAPPGRLGDYELLRNPDGTRRLRWVWDYPDLPALKGFRIYLDGERRVSEDVLTASVRSWTTQVLTKRGFLKYSIEAVMVDGSVSIRGPEQVYYYSPNN